jgi:hypothetical protein
MPKQLMLAVKHIMGATSEEFGLRKPSGRKKSPQPHMAMELNMQSFKFS